MEIENRLKRLEKESRRWRVLALVVTLLLASLVLSGQGGQTTHRCNRFVLVDEHNRERIVMMTNNKGEPVFCMKNASGTNRLRMYMVGGDPFLDFHDEAGQVWLTLNMTKNGGPVVYRKFKRSGGGSSWVSCKWHDLP